MNNYEILWNELRKRIWGKISSNSKNLRTNIGYYNILDIMDELEDTLLDKHFEDLDKIEKFLKQYDYYNKENVDKFYIPPVRV